MSQTLSFRQKLLASINLVLGLNNPSNAISTLPPACSNKANIESINHMIRQTNQTSQVQKRHSSLVETILMTVATILSFLLLRNKPRTRYRAPSSSKHTMSKVTTLWSRALRAYVAVLSQAKVSVGSWWHCMLLPRFLSLWTSPYFTSGSSTKVLWSLCVASMNSILTILNEWSYPSIITNDDSNLTMLRLHWFS